MTTLGIRVFLSSEERLRMWEIIYRELRAVPVTMILLAILYIMVVGLYKDRISPEDFRQVQAELAGD